MPTAKSRSTRKTHVVPPELFKQVYDSPQSLPGKHRWVTSDEDVRGIEKLLGLPKKSIGAPLWVSGDTRNCRKCGRETSWLDIVSSGLAKVHGKELLVNVILGERKFVNTEAPEAIQDLACAKCKAPIADLRSFKCHNWAYAIGKLAEMVELVSRRRG